MNLSNFGFWLIWHGVAHYLITKLKSGCSKLSIFFLKDICRMTINLEKHKDALVKAWKDVLDEKTSTDWSLFGYEGQTYDLKVVSTGDGGIEELREDLNGGKIMYGFCKVIDPKTSLPKYVLINWQGEGAPPHMKGTCVNHLRSLQSLLKGAHITYSARTEEEVDEEVIADKVARSSASTYSFVDRSNVAPEPNHPVSAQYTRIIASKEINTTERDKFWAVEEEKERERQESERRKKEEEIRKLEEDRINRETADMVRREEGPVDTPSLPSREQNVIREKTVRQLSEQILQGPTNTKPPTEQNEVGRRKIDMFVERIQNPAEPIDTRPSHTNLGPSQQTETHANLGPSEEIENHTNLGPIEHIEDHANLGPIEQIEDHANLGPIEQIENQANLDPSEQIESVANLGPSERIDKREVVSEATSNGVTEDDDVGLQAQALYDYQAADETEISFEPGDIITHIDQIDAGWWQGLGPNGTYGLFPANYVALV